MKITAIFSIFDVRVYLKRPKHGEIVLVNIRFFGKKAAVTNTRCCYGQGRMQDSEKGGHSSCIDNYLCKVHANCAGAKHTCMQSMPNLGGSGGMPPQKILKNYTL